MTLNVKLREEVQRYRSSELFYYSLSDSDMFHSVTSERASGIMNFDHLLINLCTCGRRSNHRTTHPWEEYL